MRRVLLASLALVALGYPVALAQDNQAQNVIEKAIAAQGGEKALLTLKAAVSKAKGSINLQDNDVSFTAETFYQTPDKIKAVLQLEIQNMNIAVIQVYNGKQGWVNVMGMTMDLDDKSLEQLKDSFHVENVTRLVTLRDKTYKLSPLGDAKVDGKACVGVQVTKQGLKDVNLYFDKASHMLLKAEYRALDPISKQEVNQEKLFSDFKDQAGGFKLATKVTINNDGKKFLHLEVTEFRIVDQHDASIFARP
jgi:hypothetical protein